MFIKATKVESKFVYQLQQWQCKTLWVRSPGYALTLLAESTTSAIYCAEAISEPGIVPEDIGLKATRALLGEVEKGVVLTRNTKPSYY